MAEFPKELTMLNLADREAQLRGILASAMDAIISVDEGQRIVLFNAAAEEMFGCPASEIIGQPLDQLIPTRFHEAHRNHIQTFGQAQVTHRRMGQLGAIVGLRSNGEEFPIEASISQAEVEGSKLFTVIMRDNSLRQHIEQGLRTRGRHKKALAEMSQAALEKVDLPDLMERAVHLLAETLEVPFTKILELLPGKQELLVKYGVGWKKGAIGQARVSANTQSSQAGYTLVSPSPVIVEDLQTDTRFSATPLLYKHGIVSGISVTIHGPDEPYGVLGVHTSIKRTFSGEEVDIVESIANVLGEAIRRNHMEDTIQQERDFITAVLDTAGALVLVLDTEGRIVNFNRTCERITGYLAEEVKGQFIWDKFILPEERDAVKSEFEKLRGGGTLSRYENYWLTYNGERRFIAWANTTLLDKTYRVEYIIATGIDLTDLKNSQDQLLKAEQLAQLGTLASGMAHEIGTPMNIILGRAESLIRKTAEEPTKKGLETIVAQVDRMTKLINQLLNVARRSPSHPRPLELKKVLGNVLNLIEERAKETNVEVETYWDDEGKFLTQGDPDHLEQVFLNLCVNAIHAMSQGGTLRLGLQVAGDQLHATVGDTGEGISKQNLSKIFDAFFSTKPKGEGSGLGLMMSQSIIQEHGGAIFVDSVVEHGTTFTVTLPLLKLASDA